MDELDDGLMLDGHVSAPGSSGRPADAISGRRRRRGFVGALVLPGCAVVAVFFFYPLAMIIWRSFSDPAIGFGNYLSLLHDGVSVTVLLRTLRTALLVAGCSFGLAYPFAYAMTRVGRRARGILTILVLLPFWTSLMARNFAWYQLEQRNGVIERILASVGIDNVVLLGSVGGVTVAMVQVMLPYMVLPLYSTMSSIDGRLMEAATSLGAPRMTAFRRIYVPLSLPGIISGFSLVFIMTLGFYVTPALLGTPHQALVSQVIGTRVNDLLDFAGAGTLGTVLLILTLIVLLVVNRIAHPTIALGETVTDA